MKKKTQMKKNPQMKKNHKRRNILLKKKPQMKKTNVEHFKEVTHEIEFMFCSDLVSLTIIACGKLIG